MIGHRECGGAPALHGVATFAAACVGTLCKLALVRIGFVAIGAGVMRNWSFEIAALMAAGTGNVDVFPKQGKVGLRVIECCGEAGFLPRGCGVARIAALFEFAFVWIAMTVRAVGELEAGVTRLIVRTRSVTALAQHVAVFAGERELGFRVIEILAIDGGGFPTKRGVTTRAVGSQSALVLVLVAVHAARRQAEPGAIQIFGSQQCARLRGNVLCCVARATANADVFAIKVIAGL